MKSKSRHIITFLPNKGNILKNGTVLLELSPYTKIELKNNELLEYLHLIIDCYNKKQINLDEYVEIKRVLLRIDSKDLLMYKDDIFKAISMNDDVKNALSYSKYMKDERNDKFKSNIGKLLNIMYLKIFYNNKVISTAMLKQMQIFGYKKVSDDHSDIEKNIEIIEYLKKDIMNDPDFYINLLTDLIENTFDINNDLELISEFNKHIKSNIIRSLQNYLDKEEEHEIVRNNELSAECIKGYVTTRVLEIAKLKRGRDVR